MKKDTRQQRINILAWKIVDFILPPNPVKKDIEDLEDGLKQVIEQLEQPKGKDERKQKYENRKKMGNAQ